MNCDYYQVEASKTAIYPDYAKILYPTLGLCGELGELVAKIYDVYWQTTAPSPGEVPYQEALLALITVGRRCELLKKQIRGAESGLDHYEEHLLKTQAKRLPNNLEFCDGVANESSDVAWYLSALLTDLNVKLSTALQQNLNKLAKRKEQGKIHNHSADSREDKQ